MALVAAVAFETNRLSAPVDADVAEREAFVSFVASAEVAEVVEYTIRVCLAKEEADAEAAENTFCAWRTKPARLADVASLAALVLRARAAPVADTIDTTLFVVLLSVPTLALVEV